MPLNRIMIIDDDEVDTYTSKRVINENSFAREIVTATSVKEAMNYLSGNRSKLPEIIFLDLNMPGLNGLDFLESFGTFTPAEKNSTRIILLMNVVNSNNEITRKATTHPLVSHVIEKPLTIAKMQGIPQK
jgi:CheY-like chemotaxis protein